MGLGRERSVVEGRRRRRLCLGEGGPAPLALDRGASDRPPRASQHPTPSRGLRGGVSTGAGCAERRASRASWAAAGGGGSSRMQEEQW